MTKWNLASSTIPPYKKAWNNLSIRMATPVSKRNKDRKLLGRLELLIKVILPPFNKYILLCLARYFIGREDTLHPKVLAKLLMLGTTLSETIFNFAKFTYSLGTTLKHRRIDLRELI